ncbi:transmembrane protein [Thraustotheca clavata]|uniref:Transmembrane protein n=1 Tax=Thraustotheca clavata TaxID=74557 RepID=A0A1V9ZVG9_9STRA|nr:transmembrane protein [Thraustotheca clavata]
MNGEIRFTFERALKAVAESDVSIDLTNPKQIINWAYGHDAWSSYHERRGNAFVSLGSSVAKQLLCDTNWFINNVSEEVLDPEGKFRMKRLLSDGQLCVKVLLNDPKATWFGISFAPKAQMVNEPVNNAIILDTTKNNPQVYALTGYEPELIVPLKTHSYLLHSATSKDGNHEFTFQRQLNAKVPTDVAIELEVNSLINWAYGHDAWPSYHHDRGSAQITFHTFDLTSTITTDYGFITTPTPWILLAFAVWGAFLGLLVTHCFGRSSHRFLDKSLAAPPRYSRDERIIDTWLWLPLSELKVGEGIALLHYIGCLAAVFVLVENSTQRWSVTSGHLAVVHLVFLLLPVARGLYWEQLFFGTSFERIVKFHRILGRLFIIFAAVHLYTNARLVNVLTSSIFGSQKVIPLYGFIAFVSFVVLGIFALPIMRRQAFELFYYTHRVAAIVGIVFAFLHAPTIRIILVVPVAIYALSYVIRAKSFFHRHQASFTSYSDNTVSVVLKSMKNLEQNIPLGAYFWVAIPSISYLEWHPFSAIATTTKDGEPTFGFVMKALTDDGFVSRAREKLENQEASVLLSGPYGNLSLRLNEYSNAVLIAGGIGITPLLHIFNELKDNSNINASLHWIVRNPAEFQSTQYFMKFDAKAVGKLHLYADEVTESGRLVISGDLPIEYSFGRPRIDDLLKSYQGTRSCVIVCGPQGLAQYVQSRARAYDLPLHKETFLL